MTGVDALTAAVVAVNVAVAAPGNTVTLAGTPAAPGLLVESVTVAPVSGAAPDNVTVPCALEPPATLAGASARLCRVADGGAGVDGVTVSVAVLVVPFLGLPVQWSIMLIGLILAAAVAEHVVHSGRLVTA